MKTLRLLPLKVLVFVALGLVSCKKDPCKKVSCQNGGTCVDGNCRCNLPWEGAKCEADARDKFVGSWSGRLRCMDGTTGTLTGTIRKSTSDPKRIIASGFPVIDRDIYAILTSSNEFSIPPQDFTDSDEDQYTISGSGVLEEGTLTIQITYEGVGLGSGRCTITAGKR